MQNKPVKLKNIAEKLNVSVVTVSKALRNHSDISKQMTATIKSVAKEMGYTPNYLARNLSSKKSHMIGVVVPKVAHFFFGDITECIYDYANEKKYEVILTVSQENAEKEKKNIQTLLSMQVDGLIISITQETKDFSVFKTLIQRGIPVVFIDRIPPLDNINIVEADNFGGAYKAITHAINLGYKKIAHFAGYSDINIGQERFRGFEQAMKDNNVPVMPYWVSRGGFGEKHGYDTFMELYKAKRLPDLIFAVTYPVALGVYMAARELGLKIPEDIDIICFGNTKVQEFLSPPLSCINQPVSQIAKNAVQLLIDNMNNRENYVPKKIEIDTNLILRGTCINFNSK